MKRTALLRKTGLSRGNYQLKRSPLRKVGENRYWLDHKKELRPTLSRIYSCEVNLSGCMHGLLLSPAHRHERLWYRDRKKLLVDPWQVIAACPPCHDQLDQRKNRELREEIFLARRGPEVLVEVEV